VIGDAASIAILRASVEQLVEQNAVLAGERAALAAENETMRRENAALLARVASCVMCGRPLGCKRIK
jgi:FtsZ-binding cell division protein ZapB